MALKVARLTFDSGQGDVVLQAWFDQHEAITFKAIQINDYDMYVIYEE